MLSIGEMASFTGVSRRMLRHWETIGLITPASIDEFTGYRWYSRMQVGRVRAISTLRSVGFSLGEIMDLLDHSQLTEGRLLEILSGREQELTAQFDEASARLTEVRSRIHAIQRGRDTIMNTVEIGALPSLRLWALHAVVNDEAEIAEAVGSLLPRLRHELNSRDISDGDIVLSYDGTIDANSIVVTAGTTAIAAPDQAPFELIGCDRGVTVRFDEAPSDIGDAWISLDTSLEEYGLQTTGAHRHTLTDTGSVILQAPVKQRSASC